MLIISDKNVEVKVNMKILNVVEIDDQLSQLTFGVRLKLIWNEPRIKILKPKLFLTHDFSKQCLWSPRVFFEDQISAQRQDLIQNDFALEISNETNQVIFYFNSSGQVSKCEFQTTLSLLPSLNN